MTTALPSHVGVIGGGRMGSGIAHAALTAGSSVVLIEADAELVGTARNNVIHAIDGSVQRGTVSESAEEITARLQVVTNMAALAGCGLIVEAVPEKRTLKDEILSTISTVAANDAIIATNTSSMSITELSQSVSQPERFIGLHFFNPVPASQLVEVVVGSATSADTVARAQEIVAAIGKTAVTVQDSPGFASSRLGLVLGLEAMRMVEDGVASAEDIDAAMVLGYKHPVGPLQLTDIVGLDVRLAIADYLAERIGERFTPPQILRDKVARGELGRKTGKGFYDWD